MIIRHIKEILFLLSIFTGLQAQVAVDISKDVKTSLLGHSSVYFDKTNELTIEQAIKKEIFEHYNASQINIGISRTTIWIKFELQNNSHTTINKLLILNSPLLEEIELYTEETLNKPTLRGIKNITSEHTTIYPTYPISIEANDSITYYIKVKCNYNPIDFSIYIDNEQSYRIEDKKQQLIKIILLSMIFILMIYNFILSLYSKDKSYFYYSFYLLTLLYQQSAYIGLSQIYLASDFIQNVELRTGLFKVTSIIISGALFAIYFLNTIKIPLLHRIYKGFIIIGFVEMVIFNIPGFYNLKLVVFTSVLFIIFNLTAATISYKRGHKQARLFIIGFSIVSLSYIMMLANALGIISIVQDYPNSLLFGTTLEALILSLAFVDRYAILTNEKELLDRSILNEIQNREKIVKQEVIKKTAELNHALKTKELLLKEIHHRIKNNLQIILSITRLQNDETEDKETVDKFIKLENRINAIAKIYNMLIVDDNLDEIDMDEYINELLIDIQETMLDDTNPIEIQTDVDISLSLSKSIYIGIIINELVTNAYKYAFDNNQGLIFISLHEQLGEYTLIIRDNGKGFTYDKKKKSLGLKLIHTLISQQLNGKVAMMTKDMTQYTIRFSK